MAEKHSVRVMIGGKVITLAGYESDEYLQRVAFYLNNKTVELESMKGYGRLNQDTKSMLLALNIADDYFKAKSQVDAMEEDIENKDQNAYDVKQDLVAARMENDRLRRENEQLRKEGEQSRSESEQLRKENEQLQNESVQQRKEDEQPQNGSEQPQNESKQLNEESGQPESRDRADDKADSHGRENHKQESHK